MDSRFKELTERLVAVGKPSFSASEMHELHDYIMESQKRKRKPRINDLLRVVIEYETKKSMDVGRQTNFFKIKEIKKKTQVELRGQKVKAIYVDTISSKYPSYSNNLPKN